MENDPDGRFDALLAAMAKGSAPRAHKPSTDQASDDACRDDTQTPQDTSEGASS